MCSSSGAGISMGGGIAGALASRRLAPSQRRRGGRLVARAADPLIPLGFDFLTFLGSTVLMIPLFRRFNISPILAFLISGALLQQFG